MTDTPAIAPDATIPTSPTTRRSASRLAAVQLIFQEEFSNTPHEVEDVIKAFGERLLRNKTSAASEELFDMEPDMDYLRTLLKGVVAQLPTLDETLFASVSSDWKPERMPPVLKAILRAGIYELTFCPDVPAKVIINEYVDVTDALVEEKDVGFVNAVLDKVARSTRPEEVGA